MSSQKMSSFSLLLAPPSWGKTHLLLDLFLRREIEGVWVYLSPLRALADEFYHRVNSSVKTHYLRSRRDLESLLGAQTLPQLVVGTPETFGEEGALWAQEKKAYFIIDEIHLFYMWGESFRPWLREYLYILGNTGKDILGLSATLSDEWLQECQREFSQAGYECHIQDYGNFKWLHAPSKFCYYAPWGRARLRRRFIRSLKDGRRAILFCETRYEVQYWVHFCQNRKITALGCVGGGVESFKKELEKAPLPLAIISTSVLGHGVNLPSFQDVYLNLVVDDRALWLQMAARGGRRGEGFVLHCLNWPGSCLWRRALTYGRTILSDEIHQWML